MNAYMRICHLFTFQKQPRAVSEPIGPPLSEMSFLLDGVSSHAISSVVVTDAQPSKVVPDTAGFGMAVVGGDTSSEGVVVADCVGDSAEVDIDIATGVPAVEPPQPAIVRAAKMPPIRVQMTTGLFRIGRRPASISR